MTHVVMTVLYTYDAWWVCIVLVSALVHFQFHFTGSLISLVGTERKNGESFGPLVLT